LKYVGQGILSIADDCLATINSVARRKRTLTATFAENRNLIDEILRESVKQDED
jgi:hypothetical protein